MGKNLYAVEGKVLGSVVDTRMKKPDKGACPQHHRANVTAFGPITEGTRVRKVLRVCWPTVFFADDVVHLAAKHRVVFMNEAVLAEEICPHRHQATQCSTDVTTHGLDRLAHGLSPAA